MWAGDIQAEIEHNSIDIRIFVFTNSSYSSHCPLFDTHDSYIDFYF